MQFNLQGFQEIFLSYISNLRLQSIRNSQLVSMFAYESLNATEESQRKRIHLLVEDNN